MNVYYQFNNSFKYSLALFSFSTNSCPLTTHRFLIGFRTSLDHIARLATLSKLPFIFEMIMTCENFYDIYIYSLGVEALIAESKAVISLSGGSSSMPYSQKAYKEREREKIEGRNEWLCPCPRW